MNKKIIAMAVSAALAAPLLAHAGAPTVYGQLNLHYGTVKKEAPTGTTTTDNWQFGSYDSRLGFKGERDFGNGLMGVYKIELAINPDGTNTAIKRRNTYAGLKGGWGELRFGRHDSPLKMSQSKFDQFGDSDGDLKHAGKQAGEHRNDNMLMYLGKSDSIGYAIQIAPGEGSGVGANNSNNGPADNVSASISYKSGPLYVALAHDKYGNPTNLAEDSMSRLIGIYKMGNMQLGLLYQSGVQAPAAASAKEDWMGVSFGAGFSGSNKFKAQYITSEDKATTKTKTTLTAIGMDHKFDKKTTGYLHYVEVKATGGSPIKNDFMTVGMNLKF